MGIINTTSMICDYCSTTTMPLERPDDPMPDAWLRVQGYATIVNGLTVQINGYFCPACVTAQGTKNLVKKSADISEELT